MSRTCHLVRHRVEGLLLNPLRGIGDWRLSILRSPSYRRLELRSLEVLSVAREGRASHRTSLPLCSRIATLERVIVTQSGYLMRVALFGVPLLSEICGIDRRSLSLNTFHLALRLYSELDSSHLMAVLLALVLTLEWLVRIGRLRPLTRLSKALLALG